MTIMEDENGDVIMLQLQQQEDEDTRDHYYLLCTSYIRQCVQSPYRGPKESWCHATQVANELLGLGKIAVEYAYRVCESKKTGNGEKYSIFCSDRNSVIP